MKLIENPKYLETISKIAAELPEKKCSILITGASGLIGSCMVDVLMEANNRYGREYTVYALGRSEQKLRDRFSYVENTDWLKYIAQDIAVPLDYAVNFDYILHAASNADPRSYALYPAETLLTNIQGATTVLNYAKQHKETRIIFTSTFETYGLIEGNQAYSEEQYGLIDFNVVRACYPESKRCAEILFRCYEEEYGINYSIARLCSIYGPSMLETDNKAHAQFIRNALNNEDIVLKSEGKPKRTYLSVFDTVSALFNIMFAGKPGEAYNVASSDSVATIAEVAQTVAGLCGRKVIFDLPSEMEQRGFSKPQDSVLAAEKLERLGWKARYNLEEGMALTINILRGL